MTTSETGSPAAAPCRARRKRTKISAAARREAAEEPLNKHWRGYFLQALAETSNVTAAAAKAGVSPSRAYKLRRDNPDFAAQWQAALQEGYDHLEIEVLGYLRNPDPARKVDVTAAIRLLAAHREAVARERALADNRDERAVLDSIDAMIDEMRERAAANAALMAEESAHAEANADADHDAEPGQTDAG